jgi:hypothetical protein
VNAAANTKIDGVETVAGDKYVLGVDRGAPGKDHTVVVCARKINGVRPPTNGTFEVVWSRELSR